MQNSNLPYPNCKLYSSPKKLQLQKKFQAKRKRRYWKKKSTSQIPRQSPTFIIQKGLSVTDHFSYQLSHMYIQAQKKIIQLVKQKYITAILMTTKINFPLSSHSKFLESYMFKIILPCQYSKPESLLSNERYQSYQ